MELQHLTALESSAIVRWEVLSMIVNFDDEKEEEGHEWDQT